MKKVIINKLYIILIIISIFFFLYPSLSMKIEKIKTTNLIKNYKPLSDKTYKELIKYNNSLLTTPSKKSTYNLLAKNEIIGYINIPKIDLLLPIYFYSNDKVLNKGVGHIEWSSFPTGGKNIHSVLTTHNGLPGKELFTRINELNKNDYFYIYVSSKVLVYKIDNISTINPNDTSLLTIIKNKNYVTLVTCIPYGINSHRLLVRGELKKIS